MAAGPSQWRDSKSTPRKIWLRATWAHPPKSFPRTTHAVGRGRWNPRVSKRISRVCPDKLPFLTSRRTKLQGIRAEGAFALCSGHPRTYLRSPGAQNRHDGDLVVGERFALEVYMTARI